jgi:hypothetical protein
MFIAPALSVAGLSHLPINKLDAPERMVQKPTDKSTGFSKSPYPPKYIECLCAQKGHRRQIEAVAILSESCFLKSKLSQFVII